MIRFRLQQQSAEQNSVANVRHVIVMLTAYWSCMGNALYFMMIILL